MPNWGKASWAEPKRRAMQKNWTAAVKDLSAIEAWNMVKEDLVSGGHGEHICAHEAKEEP